MGKLTRFFGNWITALKAFPVSHLILVFLTIYGFYLVDSHQADQERKLMIAGAFGLLISFVGPLIALHYEGSEKKIRLLNYGFQGLALVGIGCYDRIINMMGENPSYAEILLYFGVFPLMLIGILALIAWAFKRKETKTWFSWTSLLHALLFGILAGVIVRGGLSAAIGSINALFDIDIHWRWYQYFGIFSMIFLAGSFMLNHYTFVVANLPKGSSSDFELVATRLMRIFGSYIFLPLALVYLLIFAAYGIKILITGVRPKGIIVWLGTGYFVWGMLTYYFTFPEKTNFFHRIRRILFISFVLVALMMIGALGIRIKQYSLSINRYFVAMFILFIISFSISALFCSKIRLRLFISLLVGLSLISLYGPLSARNVAFFAQKTTIEMMLIKENIYLPLQKDSLKHLTGATADQVATTITDFVRTFPYEKRNKVLFNGQYSGDTKDSPRSYGYDVRTYLGAQDHYGEWNKEETKDIEFRLWIPYDFFTNKGIVTEGYHKIYELSWLGVLIKNTKLVYSLSGEKKELDLSPYLDKIYAQALKGKNRYQKEGAPFVIEQEGYQLIITQIHGKKLENGKFELEEYVQGYLLTK